MVVTFDVNDLINNNLSINDMVFLYTMHTRQFPLIESYVKHNERFYDKKSVDYLLSLGFLEKINQEEPTYMLSNLQLGPMAYKRFPKLFKAGSLEEDWIEEWYNLFPKGVKSGGYPLRSGLRGVEIKMKKFIKEFPEYPKDVIIAATKKYLEEARSNGYQYTQLAHYFIYKNNVSNLAAYCESFLEKGTDSVKHNYTYDI